MNVVDLPKDKKPLMTKKEIDNFIEAQKLFAKASWQYYSSLIAEGFTEDQALKLVMSMKYF